MFIFEELKKPACIEATLQFNAGGQKHAATWVAKFRRQTDHEKKAREKITGEKLDQVGRMEQKSSKRDDKRISADQIARATRLQAEIEAYIEDEAIEHFVGWEISDGKDGLLPETDEIRAAMLGPDAPREWRNSIVEAWKRHINPSREELVKNSETPPPSGQVVAINRG